MPKDLSTVILDRLISLEKRMDELEKQVTSIPAAQPVVSKEVGELMIKLNQAMERATVALQKAKPIIGR